MKPPKLTINHSNNILTCIFIVVVEILLRLAEGMDMKAALESTVPQRYTAPKTVWKPGQHKPESPKETSSAPQTEDQTDPWNFPQIHLKYLTIAQHLVIPLQLTWFLPTFISIGAIWRSSKRDQPSKFWPRLSRQVLFVDPPIFRGHIMSWNACKGWKPIVPQQSSRSSMRPPRKRSLFSL